MFVLALPPSLYLSFQTQGPNRGRCNQSEKLDVGQIEEKGHGYWQRRTAAMLV